MLNSVSKTGLGKAFGILHAANGTKNGKKVSIKVAALQVTSRDLHVAIVGSGPAGFYAADELIRRNIPDLQIDMYEKLPCPFGLVRSGVAPDHPEVKSVQTVFHALAKGPSFNFLGNVTVGRDVSIEELKQKYQAIVLAYGAEDDRKLGVPGEDLKGVHSARTFVEWYNGLTDQLPADTFDLSGRDAVIIGNGNVAVDVARILLTPITSLSKTDISSVALNKLKESQVSHVQIVGRRGPVQAAFTTKELRELLKIEQCSSLLADGFLMITEPDEKELESRAKKRQFELLQQLISRVPSKDPTTRELYFNFYKNPVGFLEDPNRPGHVGSVKFEVCRLEGKAGSQRAVGINFFVDIPAQIVFKSIGYKSKPITGLPFDHSKHLIPNERGKVERGIYACGWIKRGPSGIIGTNKYDAEEVVQVMIEDYLSKDDVKTIKGDVKTSKDVVQTSNDDVLTVNGNLDLLAKETLDAVDAASHTPLEIPKSDVPLVTKPSSKIPKHCTISGDPIPASPREDIVRLLKERNVQVVTYDDWELIDAEEIVRGNAKQKLREKIVTTKEMLAVINSRKL